VLATIRFQSINRTVWSTTTAAIALWDGWQLWWRSGLHANNADQWYSSPEVAEPALPLNGAAWRYDPREDPTDHPFEQGGKLYRLMDEAHKEILIGNTARAMTGVRENIKYRHATHCYLADEDYGKRISKALGLDLAKVKAYAKLSINELNRATADTL